MEIQNPEKIDQNKSFSFFYKGFNHNYRYWESIILARKFLLCLISALKESLQEEQTWILILVVLLFFLLITLKSLPYSHRKANFLEILSLITCVFSAFASFILNSNNKHDEFEIFLAVMTIFLNLIFFVYALTNLACQSFTQMKKLKKIKNKKETAKSKSKNIALFKKGTKLKQMN